MKKIAFIIILICFQLGFCQSDEDAYNEIISTLRKCKAFEVDDVLDFQVNGQLGFINRKTMETIVAPDYSNLNITGIAPLQGRLTYDTFIDDYYYEFSVNEKWDLTIKKKINYSCILYDLKKTEEKYTFKISDKLKTGFVVKGKKVIISSKYVNDDFSFYDDMVFKYNGNFYIILNRKENNISKYGIINENGNIQKNFNFQHSYIAINHFSSTPDNTWFFVQENPNAMGSFINMEGEKKLTNAVPNDSGRKNKLFEYIIVEDKHNNAHGVLNLAKMEWVIPYQKQYEFTDFAYIKNKKNTDILITARSYSRHFYMSLDSKKYLPAEYENNESLLPPEAFVEQRIKDYFSGYDSTTIQQLIPFEIGFGNEGLIDAKTMKIAQKPQFGINVSRDLFSPKIKGNMYAKNKTFEFYYHPESGVELIPKPEVTEKEKAYSTNYEYRAKKIIAAQNTYNYEDIFYHNEKKYTLVHKIINNRKLYAVLDENKNPIAGFNFQHQFIERNPYANDPDDIWFFTQEKDNLKASLTSLSGKSNFKNELLPVIDKKTLGYYLFYDLNEQLFGIFDMVDLKWIIPMQSKYRLADIKYTSQKNIDPKNITDRKFATVYFMISDRYNLYYMDLSLKKMIPETYFIKETKKIIMKMN